MTDIHLVLVSDSRYRDLTAIAMHTAYRSSKDPERLTVHVLWSGAPDDADGLRVVARRWGGRCDVLRVDERVAADDRFQGLTPHYYRLLAPELLPADVSRFVYLDSDLLVLTDLAELVTLDLDGCTVAACVDYIPTVAGAMANHEALGLRGDRPYFNSGVMAVDRARWAAERVSDRVLRATRDHAAYLDAQGRFHQYDQYGLNLALYGRWKALPDTWNRGAEYPYIEAHIVHFNGHGRPWGPTCMPEYRALFEDARREIGGDFPPADAADPVRTTPPGPWTS